jgi:hypothetical protein
VTPPRPFSPRVCCRCCSRCCCCYGPCIPPLVLFAPAPNLLIVVPRDVLGKAFVPLHHCGVAEPELLLCGVGGVRACAGNISPRCPRHCLYHRCRRRLSKTRGVLPTIAPYMSVIILLLVITVLAPHCLEPTPTSVLVAVIIGALLGAAQHVKEVGGLIHQEPLLVQFLNLITIGRAEGALAVHLPPLPVQSLLLLLVPMFLPIYIQRMVTWLPPTCGSIVRQPGYCCSTATWAATTRIAKTRTTMTLGTAIATTVGRAEDGNGTDGGGTPPL